MGIEFYQIYCIELMLDYMNQIALFDQTDYKDQKLYHYVPNIDIH